MTAELCVRVAVGLFVFESLWLLRPVDISSAIDGDACWFDNDAFADEDDDDDDDKKCVCCFEPSRDGLPVPLPLPLPLNDDDAFGNPIYGWNSG